MELKNLFVAVIACCFFSNVAVQAQDTLVNQLEEVIVSDTKFEIKRRNSGKVVTKITEAILKQHQGKSIAEVLNTVSGITINAATSYAGSDLGLYARGGRNRQTVIRIDGVTVTDPSSTSNSFDLRLLPVDQIESIEVLKGASSTLYGSGAATVVINIALKQEEKKAFAANYTSSIGTQQAQEDQDYDIRDFQNNLSFSGTSGNFYYSSSFNQQFTDGLSSNESEDADFPFEEDRFKKLNVYSKIGYKFGDNLDIHLYGNYDEFEAEFDDGVFDAENDSKSEQKRIGSYLKYRFKNGSFTWTDGYTWLNRELFGSFPTKYESRFYTFDSFFSYEINELLKFVIGANGAYSDFSFASKAPAATTFVTSIEDNEADFDIIDPYLNAVYLSNFGLNINAGFRLNMHSKYGNQLVYSFNPSYVFEIDETRYVKLLSSYSTSYITPTLFQLFDTAFGTGNPDLKPEESATFEAGTESVFSKNISGSVVYFNRTSKNYILSGPPTFRNDNSNSEFTVTGLEVELNAQVLDEKLQLRANYTYTDLSDLEGGLGIRLPKNQFTTTVGSQLTEKTFVSIGAQLIGSRADTFFDPVSFASSKVELSSYKLFDFYINHQALENLTLFASVTNLTNEDYQEIVRFSTKGRNASIGFRLNF